MATDPHLDHTNGVVIPPESDYPGERISSIPPRLATFKEGVRLLNRYGWAPSEVARDFGILMVSFEDDGCVFPLNTPNKTVA